MAASLKVTVDSIKSGGTVPNKYAFCVPAAAGHTAGGQNINPSISWSKGPKGTQSYAVILYDTDSPAEHRELMNKEGVSMTSDVKRHDFFHWILSTFRRRSLRSRRAPIRTPACCTASRPPPPSA